MPTPHSPRKGSMQVWPRKRSTKPLARVRAWATSKDAKTLGFIGYKVGMTHIAIKDSRKATLTKGKIIVEPVTVVECPPMKVMGYRAYTKDGYGMKAAGEIYVEKFDKEVLRKRNAPKKQSGNFPEKFDDLRLIIHTQPKLAKLKKTPEILEIGIGGSDANAKLEYAKSVLGKEITASDVFTEGKYLDVHAVTKGKGFQGPVKRHGVSIRFHKSEKTKRGPGSLGPWTGNRSTTVAHAGQTGYHRRTEYNKRILKIGDKPEEVNPSGGFIRYGEVNSTYMLIKGSIGGTSKRAVIMTEPIRPNPKFITDTPQITKISTISKQRR